MSVVHVSNITKKYVFVSTACDSHHVLEKHVKECCSNNICGKNRSNYFYIM